MPPALIGRDPLRTCNARVPFDHLSYYRTGSVRMSIPTGLDMVVLDINLKAAGWPWFEQPGDKMQKRLLTHRRTESSSIEEVERWHSPS